MCTTWHYHTVKVIIFSIITSIKYLYFGGSFGNGTSCDMPVPHVNAYREKKIHSNAVQNRQEKNGAHVHIAIKCVGNSRELYMKRMVCETDGVEN